MKLEICVASYWYMDSKTMIQCLKTLVFTDYGVRQDYATSTRLIL